MEVLVVLVVHALLVVVSAVSVVDLVENGAAKEQQVLVVDILVAVLLIVMEFLVVAVLIVLVLINRTHPSSILVMDMSLLTNSKFKMQLFQNKHSLKKYYT
jgi:hypothetical protein